MTVLHAAIRAALYTDAAHVRVAADGEERLMAAIDGEARNARAALDAALSEKAFMQSILDLAWWCGWECAYHPYDSRRSDPGFPDLTLVSTSRRRCIFVEVKTERGRVTADQRRWHDALRAAGQDVHVWRPSDWLMIERTMKEE